MCWQTSALFFLPFLAQWSVSVTPEVRRCLRCSGALGLSHLYYHYSSGFLAEFQLLSVLLVTVLSFLEAAGVDLLPKEDFALSLAFPVSLWHPLPLLLSVIYCVFRLLLESGKVLAANSASRILGTVALACSACSAGGLLLHSHCVGELFGAASLFAGALSLHQAVPKPHGE